MGCSGAAGASGGFRRCDAAPDQSLTELRNGVRRLTGPIRTKVSSTPGFLRLKRSFETSPGFILTSM
jgi:hypothetical protein